MALLAAATAMAVAETDALATALANGSAPELRRWRVARRTLARAQLAAARATRRFAAALSVDEVAIAPALAPSSGRAADAASQLGVARKVLAGARARLAALRGRVAGRESDAFLALALEVGERTGADVMALYGAWTSAPAERVDAILRALAAAGRPYEWAREGPGLFDCSGLTLFAWAGHLELEHWAAGQHGGAHPVSIADAAPGDLVFYRGGPNAGGVLGIGHVQMYLGAGAVVHATRPVVTVATVGSAVAIADPTR